MILPALSPSLAIPLQLGLEEIANHLLARNVRRLPQRREVERAGQAVGEAEEEHGRDPAARVLEREAGLGHLVLLDVAAAQVVHASRRVDLGLVLARHVGHLGAGEDVEVVVGGVAAAVAFCSDGGAWRETVNGISFFLFFSFFFMFEGGCNYVPKMMRYSVMPTRATRKKKGVSNSPILYLLSQVKKDPGIISTHWRE